jgi:hypothetical protein
VNRKAIKEAEGLFDSHSRVEANLLHEIFGDTKAAAGSSVSREIKRLRNEFQKVFSGEQTH